MISSPYLLQRAASLARGGPEGRPYPGRSIGLLLLVLGWLPGSLLAQPPQDYVPDVVYESDDGATSVEAMGNGVYLFRWQPGLYVSPFLVADDQVLAVDPINAAVAVLYRQAVAAVTDAPITKIVYSHDHRDHIVGADVLAPNAQRYAHRGTAATIKRRADPDIPLPTVLVDDGDRIAVGQRSLGVHYFGPNHGASNIALSFDTASGMMLVLVDTIEIGIVPYRSLPDTNFHGYLTSLERAMALQPRWVLGGHSGPGSGLWLNQFHQYFEDMRQALAQAEKNHPFVGPAAGEDFIHASERQNRAVIVDTVNQLRPKYGSWYGFEEWAPMNADSIRMAIIIGQ